MTRWFLSNSLCNETRLKSISAAVLWRRWRRVGHSLLLQSLATSLKLHVLRQRRQGRHQNLHPCQRKCSFGRGGWRREWTLFVPFGKDTVPESSTGQSNPHATNVQVYPETCQQCVKQTHKWRGAGNTLRVSTSVLLFSCESGLFKPGGVDTMQRLPQPCFIPVRVNRECGGLLRNQQLASG